MRAEPLKVSREQARAFARRALLLDRRIEGAGAALSHLGYVQLDPLNVCGRMHDLILRNRVSAYSEGDLLRALHGDDTEGGSRLGFEHYIPGTGVLVAWPRAAYPHIRAHLERNPPREGWRALTGAEKPLARAVLDELAARGPLTSDDIAHEGSTVTAWGSRGRTVKVVLEKLFAAGHVMISRRREFRRVYDLTSRVFPEATETPSPAESRRWRAALRLRQLRLCRLRKDELSVLRGAVREVHVEGAPSLYCLAEDAGLFEEAMVGPTDDMPLLVAPLDPLIYDRALTRRLWDFDFTWEVYTPAARRRRGYYSLPVLAGTEFVGDVEPRADRRAGRLTLVSRRVRRGFRTSKARAELARFLGLR